MSNAIQTGAPPLNYEIFGVTETPFLAGSFRKKMRDIFSREVKEIKNLYGPSFSTIVGAANIAVLKEVPAAQLRLEGEDSYYQEVVKPAFLKGEPAVRGILGLNRPFIAINMEVMDVRTQKVLGVFTDVFHKRYSQDADGGPGRAQENNYVSLITMITDDYKPNDPYEKKSSHIMASLLRGPGDLGKQQMEIIRDLLAEKEVQVPHSSYSLRMVTSLP